MGKKKESLLSKEGTDRNCATFNREGYGLHTPGKRQEFFHYCLQALSSTFLHCTNMFTVNKTNGIALIWNFLGIHLSNAVPPPPCVVTAGPWVAVW